MARAAEAGSDLVVATSDNPRLEDPERILDDIMAGFWNPHSVVRIEDRRVAIEAALERADTGDMIVLAGKGHEDYQDIGGERRPWSDAEVVAELLGGSSAHGEGRSHGARDRVGSANGMS